MENKDSIYMKRCLELAMQACGAVAPNPMVGAVLVYNNEIIGEGYHQQYGGPHAEVNCINSVLAENKKFIPNSTLYVSLEPCNHHGKTPPCSDLIIQHKIPELVIGCKDPFELVNGTGIEKLKKAGVNVHPFLLEKEANELNKRFFLFHQKKRPYIILKWAQTEDEFISLPDGIPLRISNEITNQLVHKWRSEEAAIIVGTNTAINDNPSLTNRHWSGANPIRIIIDKKLKVPTDNKIYDQSSVTYIFNELEEKNIGNLSFILLNNKSSVINQINEYLFKNGILSLIVEGGSYLLQKYIDEGIWDEARVITNTKQSIKIGIKSPILKNQHCNKVQKIRNDEIAYFSPITTLANND